MSDAPRAGYAEQGRARVLIADDDPLVRSVLAAQLEREFDLLPAATDAEEATRLAREHCPDAALVDVQMPGGGGLEATRAISECSPATAIVALSGDEEHEDVVRILDAGALAYLRKGVSAKELIQTLRQALAARASGGPAA